MISQLLPLVKNAQFITTYYWSSQVALLNQEVTVRSFPLLHIAWNYVLRKFSGLYFASFKASMESRGMKNEVLEVHRLHSWKAQRNTSFGLTLSYAAC